MLSDRKAAVPDAIGQVAGTPPGPERGACVHGGSSGTWEHLRSPCRMYRKHGLAGRPTDRALVGRFRSC